MKPNTLIVLTDAEHDELLNAALKIVEQIGVLVTHRESVDLLLAAGARRGKDDRLCMDGALLLDLVAKAPSSFKLYSRRGDALEVGSDRCWTMCGGTASQVADWPGWSLRSASRQDVVRFARLCDALRLVHCVVPLVEAQDVERVQAEAVTFMETLSNTTKFVIVCPIKHASARAWVRMGRVVSGTDDLSTEPKIGLLATVLPDMHLDDECAATTVLAATEGIPLVAMAGNIAGSSGPNTIASSVALKLAAGLFQTALAQAARPGAPVLLDCTGTVVLDMNTADLGEAGPEHVLGLCATVQVARELKLPIYSCALHCEAKTGDFQAGLEKMANMMAAMLAGVHLTTNLGMVSRCSVASLEQLLMDHELCVFLQRIAQGVAVNDDTLALDVIGEVGMGGNFLMHEHTLRHCRSGEIWYPRLLDRTASGAERQDFYDRAHAQVEKILASHQPAVDGATRKALQSCVEEPAL